MDLPSTLCRGNCIFFRPPWPGPRPVKRRPAISGEGHWLQDTAFHVIYKMYSVIDYAFERAPVWVWPGHSGPGPHIVRTVDDSHLQHIMDLDVRCYDGSFLSCSLFALVSLSLAEAFCILCHLLSFCSNFMWTPKPETPTRRWAAVGKHASFFPRWFTALLRRTYHAILLYSRAFPLYLPLYLPSYLSYTSVAAAVDAVYASFRIGINLHRQGKAPPSCLTPV